MAKLVGAALSQFSLLTLHVGLFFILCLAGGILVYVIEAAAGAGREFVDALFIAVSSTCLGSLDTVFAASLSAGSQAVLCALMLVGGILLPSVVPVLMRAAAVRRVTREALAARGSSGAALEALVAAALASNDEYSALQLLWQCVLLYWFAVQAAAVVVVGTAASLTPFLLPGDVSPWWFAVFSCACKREREK